MRRAPSDYLLVNIWNFEIYNKKRLPIPIYGRMIVLPKHAPENGKRR